MNNHKTRIEIINNIKYHVLDYSNPTIKDRKKLEKFISKNKYVKLINRNYNILEFYYKNGQIHNDIGPAIILINGKNNKIEKVEYYLNDVIISEKKWKIQFRKYKLLNLTNYNDDF